MEDLERRVRRWTRFFIAALVVSGATAIPIPTQLAMAVRLLGEDLRAGGAVPESMVVWLQTLRDGIRNTSDHAPFLFYGTDWLAFGHLAIAFAFVGAVRDPLRNRWLYRFGMVACAAVPPWAFLFGTIRDIPVWWRVVDSTFGVIGFVPMWLCHRWTARLEAAPAMNVYGGGDGDSHRAAG